MNLAELKINVGEPILRTLDDWTPDYALMRDFAATRTRTTGDAATVWELAQDAARCVRMPAAVVAAILALEYDFPERKLYRANATRDDGSTLYRGITQASKPFWKDVTELARGKGFRIRASQPESATLFEQILAPFIYLDRYRSSVSGHLVTPAMIYALHQQGPGAAKTDFSRVTLSNQSSRSAKVVRVAMSGAKGRQLDGYI